MGGLLVSTFVVMGMAIQNPGTCPAVADVERHLAPLLPPGFQSSTSDVAVIKENGDGSLTLSLARFDRGTMVQRRLPGAPTCADQAETVAVTLAVWEAQTHPEISLRLDRLPSEAPAAQVPDVDLTTTALSDDAGTPRRPTARTLGVGFAGAWQPGSFAPATRLDATIGRIESRWRTRFSLVGLGEHTTSLPPGKATWGRLYLAFAVDYSMTLGAASRWAVGLGLGIAPGLVRITGSGYAVNYNVWNTDLGSELLARVEWRGARVRPWAGLALVQWVRRQNLEVTGAATTPTLPRGEPMAFVGVDFPWAQ